jgi:hypothetical protein
VPAGHSRVAHHSHRVTAISRRFVTGRSHETLGVVLVVPSLLVLVGCQAAEAHLDAAGVVPAVDVAQQGRLGFGPGGERGAGPVQQLGLDGRPQILRQGVSVS